MLDRHFFKAGKPRHRAVIVKNLAEDARREKTCKAREINCRFCMSITGKNAAVLCNKGEYMSGTSQIVRAAFWVNQRFNRNFPVKCGNTSCGVFLCINTDGKVR